MSKFYNIEVIIPWNELERRKIELLLLNNRGKAQKKLITLFKEILIAVLYITVENLFFLI